MVWLQQWGHRTFIRGPPSSGSSHSSCCCSPGLPALHRRLRCRHARCVPAFGEQRVVQAAGVSQHVLRVWHVLQPWREVLQRKAPNLPWDSAHRRARRCARCQSSTQSTMQLCLSTMLRIMMPCTRRRTVTALHKCSLCGIFGGIACIVTASRIRGMKR